MKKEKKEKLVDNIASFKIELKKIKIKDRIRQDIGNLKELKESIQKYGQLNPLIVDSQYRLIAGERRYRVLKSLGIKEVEVKIIKGIDDYDKLALEIEENSTRKDFTNKEYYDALEKKKLLGIKQESFFSLSMGVFSLSHKKMERALTHFISPALVAIGFLFQNKKV